MSPALMSLGLIGYLALLSSRVRTALAAANTTDDPTTIRRARTAVAALAAFTGLLIWLAPPSGPTDRRCRPAGTHRPTHVEHT